MSRATGGATPFLALLVLCAVATVATGSVVVFGISAEVAGATLPPPAPPAKCGSVAGCILKGNHIAKASVKDAGECCDLCQNEPSGGCFIFTVNENLSSDNCYLFQEDMYFDESDDEGWTCGYTIF